MNPVPGTIRFTSTLLLLVVGLSLLVSVVPSSSAEHYKPPNARRTSLRSFFSDRFNDTVGTTNSSNTTASIVSTACIGDDAGLRKAVAAASTNLDPKTPATLITICARVKISNTKDPKMMNLTGINMSGKNIDLKCFNPTGGRCALDGQRSSRLLFGAGTALRATNIDFINAYVPLGDAPNNIQFEGSAMTFVSKLGLIKSRITLIRCSFRNNKNDNGQGGAAVYIGFSSLTLSATPESPMVFSNNSAIFGGALYLSQTKLVLETGNVVFFNNTATSGGALWLYDSNTSMKGATFLSNFATNGGAIQIESGNTTLQDVKFVNNTASGPHGAILISDGKADMKRVSFLGNSGSQYGGLAADNSVVNLDGCTFRNNKVQKSDGADIFIWDNDDPITDDGSFVSCNNTVFCNGVSKKRILDLAGFKNTNCMEKGIAKVCRGRMFP